MRQAYEYHEPSIPRPAAQYRSLRSILLALGLILSATAAGSVHAQELPPLAEVPEEAPPDLPPAIEGNRAAAPAKAAKPAEGVQELPGEVESKAREATAPPAPEDRKVDAMVAPVSDAGKAQPALPEDPDATEAGAPRDDAVIRVQNEAPPLGGSDTGGNQYRPGTQGVGIYVEVVSPPSANLQQETTYRVIVKNAMRSPAYGVVVTDILPDGLTYVKSEPAAKAEGSTLTWDLGEMPIGSEKTLTVVAKPTKVAPLEHTATVTCRTGTRSRMVIQEPKLKVEQTMTPTKPLKGQPVQLRLVVSNPGTGAARNVAVVVKVSQGLQDSQGSRVFDQEIKRLGPGERMELQPLTLMTVGGGAQTCDTSLASPDVATEQPEAKSSFSIEVLEPKLKMTFAGPSQKYTNTEDIYELTVENPGTAQARNVRLTVFVPDSKGVKRASRGGMLNGASRKLEWFVDAIEPGASKSLKFEYRVEAMGTYPFTAEGRADGGLADKQSVTTTVTGVADVDFQLTENSRVIDVGKTTDYLITVRNHGTKDAVNLLIRAILSENLQIVETDGHEGEAKLNEADPKETLFPKVDHLPAGQEMTYVIRVKGVKPGLASCRVFLHHDDLGNERLEKQVVTPRVTDRTQIGSTAAKPAGK
jgi:uncharacterized repeat protein (TIGR01451 family)